METKYKKPDWAVDQTTRASGLVEDICVHGVGHPNLEWLAEHDPDDKYYFSVHGCDGCCAQRVEEKKGMNDEELKKVIEEYGMREGFEDVLGIISDLIEERGDMLDYSIKSRWRV